tara:strand:+ start:979 stop:2757 length:1779 start_codon:yes stop_codon:yes gene_type:complete
MLVHFVWQGLLVALIYRVWEVAVRPAAATTRYWMALLAMVVITICPVVTLTRAYEAGSMPTADIVSVEPPSGSRGLESVQAARSLPANSDRQKHDVYDRAEASRVVVGRNHSQPLAGNDSAGLTFDALRPCILGVWLVGVVFCGARLLGGAWAIFRLRGQRTEIVPSLARRAQQIGRRFGLATTPVFGSARIGEAAVVGFLRPVVLMPVSWLTSLPVDVLEAVIAHELAHIRRHDVWVNLFQCFVEALLFYHPAVWWLSNRIRVEREMCCDELAVEATSGPVSYAIALEHVGSLSAHKTPNLAASFSGDQKMNLLRRVKNVLQPNDHAAKDPTWLAGVSALMFPLFLVFVSGGQGDFVRTALAQEREGVRSAEAVSGSRESVEQEVRRSPEAERGPVRSVEAGKSVGHSVEDESGGGSSDAGKIIDEQDELKDFKPQTAREQALFDLIQGLRREMASLRHDVRSSERVHQASTDRRKGDVARPGKTAWRKTKNGRVFKAYDHDDDDAVTLNEWLAMTNGNINDARRTLQTERFHAAEPSGDGKFTPEEFIQWYSVDRHANRREGDRVRNGEEGERGLNSDESSSASNGGKQE